MNSTQNTKYKKIKTGTYPKEWEIRNLDDVSTIIDCKHSTAPAAEYKTDWIYLRNYNISDQGKLDFTNIKYITEETYNSWTRRGELKGGDIVFSYEAPVGPAAIIPNGVKIALGNRLVYIRPKSILLNQYLLYYLLSPVVQRYMIRISKGSTVLKLGVIQTRRLPIAIPKIPEQKKIGSILSNIDYLIIKTKSIIENLQLLKNGLMQRLFTEGIGHTEFKETRVGKIPKEWEIIKLKQIVSTEKFAIVDGPFGTQLHSDEYVNEGIPLVRVNDIAIEGFFKSKELTFITEEKFQELKRSAIKPGDILLAKTGATIGKVCVFPNKFDKGLIASSCAKISVDPIKAKNKYVFYFLLSNYGYRQILSLATGSTRPSINLTPISSIKIPLPSINEQIKIINILSNIDKKFQNEKKIKKRYKEIKKGLMQDLLTGKKRVKIK